MTDYYDWLNRVISQPLDAEEIRVEERWRHMRDIAIKAVIKDDLPICEHCGDRPAVCLGKYEAMRDPAFACDDCCGHGCEDGHCEILSDDDEDDDE